MNEMIAKAQEMLDRSDFIRSMGIRITDLSEDKATGRMPFDSKHCNPGGTMHGGALYSLADTVAGTLAYSKGTDVVTVDGTMHFLDSAHDTEYVYCDAVIKRCGAHLIVTETEIRDDHGKLLDTGCFTYFRT